MFGRQRWTSWLVVASLLLAQPAAWLGDRHESLVDDAACVAPEGAGLVGEHHQFGAQVEAPRPSSPTDHCVFCHLQRSAGGTRVARASLSAPIVKACGAALESSGALLAPALRHVSPRGPPVFLS
jgi:hypothetical protein